MKSKISKYFKEISYIFCICTVIDPRLKLDGVQFILQEFHQQMSHTDLNVDGYFENVKRALNNVFDDYSDLLPLG